MKKTTLIAGLSIFCLTATTSCKKDYDCICRDANGEVKATFKYKNELKKEAKDNCDSWDASYKINDGSCSL